MSASAADCDVQSYINDATARARQKWPRDTSVVNINNSAWFDLKKQRDADGQNEELAAAEHYMYARYMVSQGGKSSYYTMMAFVAGYDGVKMLLEGLGVYTFQGDNMLKILSSDGTKPTPASILSVRWGRYGCADGLTDYNNK